MKPLLWIGLGLIGLMLITPQHPAGGFGWDLGNGIGLAAFSAVCYLAVSSGPGRSLAGHTRIAWLAVIGIFVHAGYFLLLDPMVYQYLKPAAPFYMWCGVISLFVALAVAVSALPRFRRRVFRKPAWFGPLHWGLSTTCLFAGGYHIAGSGFYLNTGLQQVLFGGLLTGLVLIPWLFRRNGRSISSGEATWVRTSLVLISLGVVFAVSRQL
ncbi:MAG: hypothetical protein O3A63_20930 [Proteobacteria bacterium]|nr:hypothetical protein [Pseudomonadota bacterium]